MAKSFRCGRAGHSQQQGCFPWSPLCPFLPICLQVCPYGESRVAVLISSHQACMCPQAEVVSEHAGPNLPLSSTSDTFSRTIPSVPPPSDEPGEASVPVNPPYPVEVPPGGLLMQRLPLLGTCPPGVHVPPRPMTGQNPWASRLWSPCQICSHQNGRISVFLCPFELKFEPATDEEPF